MECNPTERRATIVVIFGIILFLQRECLSGDLQFYPTLAIVLLSCTAVFFLSFSDSPIEKVYRKNAAVGYLCCPLLPVCVLVSRDIDDVSNISSVTFALGSMIAAVAASGWSAKTETHTTLWRTAMFAVGIASLVWISAFFSVSQGFLLTAALLVLQLYLFRLLSEKLPQTFTAGELAIVTQGICLFILRATLLYQTAAGQILNQLHLSSDVECILFIQTAVLSSSLVVLILYAFDWFRSPLRYYILVISVAGLFSFPLLGFYFRQDFVSWLVNLICQDHKKISLFAYWSMWSLALWVITYLNASSNKVVRPKRLSERNATFSALRSRESVNFLTVHEQEGISSKDDADKSGAEHPSSKRRKLDAAEDKESDARRPEDAAGDVLLASVGSRCRKWSSLTVTRKQFHVAAVAIFVPGLLYDVRLICMASSCALVVLVMMETLRVLRVPPFGEAIERYFQVFVDERDAGLVITTHLYLLIGCSSPLWLYNGARPASLVLYSGLLSLGVGDTFASVVGSKYGRHKWRDSSKSIEGSVASFVSQLMFAHLIQISGHVTSLSYAGLSLCLLLNSLLEAFTSQIDNLILPLFTYLLVASVT